MRVSLRERMTVAWNTLRDEKQSCLLLRGPLPLWMQNAFEEEAERRGEPVGSVLYDALAKEAGALIQREQAHNAQKANPCAP